MNIKGIGAPSSLNFYNKVAGSRIAKIENPTAGDRIEISEAAKVLKDYSVESESYDNSAKVQEIKNRISNGTYNIDAKLTAKSMLDVMKGIK